MFDQQKRHDARMGVRKGIDVGVGLVVAALLLHGCDAPASAVSRHVASSSMSHVSRLKTDFKH